MIHSILTAPVIYHLSEIGVNVDAIICVKAQNYESLTPAPEQQDENRDGEEESAKVRINFFISHSYVWDRFTRVLFAYMRSFPDHVTKLKFSTRPKLFFFKLLKLEILTVLTGIEFAW